MKILYVSDVHTEKPDYAGMPAFPTDVDVIVFAGDLGHKKSIDLWLEMLHYASKCAKHVIVVLGNHEHYGFDFTSAVNFYRDQIAMFELQNVHLLECETIIIGRDGLVKNTPDEDSVTFFGCTLWVNATHEARKRYDYKCRGSKLTPELVAARHAHSKAWLRDELVKCVGTSVVVTHHVPIRPKHKSSGHGGDDGHISHWTDMSEFITTHQPNLWIYGHDHNRRTTIIEKTTLVTSPVGYVDEELRYKHHIIEV